MKTKKPNLFIVGMPKSGSTSLYYYLKEHQEIYFPSETKESRYFNKNNKNKNYQDRKDYLDLYNDVKDEKIIGDASISYLREKGIDKKIKKFNSEAKIIIILRGPETWMVSAYNQKYGREEGSSPEEMNKFLKKKNNRFEKMLKENYKNVKDYKKTFGKNLKIILQEELKNKSLKTYKEILEFLGVENKGFVPSFKTYNVHGKHRSKILSKFKKYLRKNLPKNQLKFLRKVTPFKLRGWLYQANRKKVKKPELSSEVKFKIKREFFPYVKELEEVTGNPLLKIWGLKN